MPSTEVNQLVNQSRTQKPADGSMRPERLFYVIAGSLALAITLGGFRFFILHGKGFGGDEITSRIVPLVVVHGLAMFSWVVLFLLQSILILAGNRRLHSLLGSAGAVLAAMIVILGSATAVLSVHFNPGIYQPLGGARFFLAIMLEEMCCFGVFVALGIIYRRRAEIHRPMMLLATVIITSGSLSRFPYTSELGVRPPLYAHGPMLLLATLLLLLQWGMSRVASRAYAAGFAGLVVAAVVSIVVGHSAPWIRLTQMIVP